ncbi:MAG TPA: glycosyltransferase family 2 protein, partial [Candidatus Xenobia bacterium]
MKLSVVIPVYNEKDTIAKVVEQVLKVDLPAHLEREVLLVDDGSNDGSSAVLDELASTLPLTVVHLTPNRGKGVAVRTGLERASGDILLIQDADLEYDPQDYPALLAPILDGRAKVVYGSRFLGRPQGMTSLHWLGNFILSITASILFGQKLTDAYTCYKVMRREVAQRISLRSRGFELEAELTAKILKQGHHV